MTTTTAFQGIHRRRSVNVRRPALAELRQLPANRGDPAYTMSFEPHDHFTCADFRPVITNAVDKTA